MHTIEIFKGISNCRLKINVYAVTRRFYSEDCRKKKKGLIFGIYEGENLGEILFTKSALKYNDKLHGKLYQLIKKTGPQITSEETETFNKNKEYWTVSLIGSSKEKLGYNKLKTINELVYQAAGLGVKKHWKTRICIKDLYYPDGTAKGSAIAIWIYQENRFRQYWIMLELVDNYNLKSIDCAPKTVKVMVNDTDRNLLKQLNAYLNVVCEPPVFFDISYCDVYGIIRGIFALFSGMTIKHGGIVMDINHKESMDLVDSIHYRQNSFHPRFIIDVGTCKNALRQSVSAIFIKSQKLWIQFCHKKNKFLNYDIYNKEKVSGLVCLVTAFLQKCTGFLMEDKSLIYLTQNQMNARILIQLLYQLSCPSEGMKA